MRLRLLAAILVATALPVHVFAQAPNPFFVPTDPTAVAPVPAAILKSGVDNGQFRIALPSGEKLVFDSVSVRVSAGVRTITGTQGDARLLLTTDGNNGYGYIARNGNYFVIDTIDGEVLIADSATLPDPRSIHNGAGADFFIDEEFLLQQRMKNAANSTAMSLAGTTVDIAFFYDQSFANNKGLQAPRTVAQAAVDYTNAAITTNNVDLEIRLVYVGPLTSPIVGNDPWGTFLADSDKWTTATEFGADLLHYIYTYSGQSYCGRAYLQHRIGVSAEDCGSETIAHEIGHNFGMQHDRPNAGSELFPYSPYAYGYDCDGLGTIMSYTNPNVPFYSSPLLDNNGQVCGVDIGAPDAAYNGAVFTQTMGLTEAYETEQTYLGDVWIGTVGPINVNEDAGSPIAITIIRDGDTTQPASVEIGSVPGTATPDRDYIDFVQRVDFAAGEASKIINIDILDDEAYEPATESFTVVLRYPQALTVVGSSPDVVITSEDPNRGIAEFANLNYAVWLDEDEGTVNIPIVRVGPTNEQLTVQAAHSTDVSHVYWKTADEGVHYVDFTGPVTFAAGSSQANIQLTAIDDNIFNGYSYVRFWMALVGDNVNLAGDTKQILIWNDDLYTGQLRFASDNFYVAENAGQAKIVVERVNGDEGDFSFWVRNNGVGTAIPYTDYSAYTSNGRVMNNGELSETILTNVFDNAAVEGDKYFEVTLDSTEIATVAPTTARVYIIDDDAPTVNGGEITLASSSQSTAEDNAVIDVVVQRVGGSSGAAIADYATVAGSATDGSDFTGVSGQLSWADGDSSDRVISIPVQWDIWLEPDETLDFNLSNIFGATAGSTLSSTLTISNDDSPGEIVMNQASATVTENNSVVLQINRIGGVSNSVSVNYSVSGGNATEGIDFWNMTGSTSWSQGDAAPKAITLFAYDDGETEFDETATISLSNPGGGATVGNPSSTTITIAANGFAALEPKPIALPDINGNGSADVMVLREGSIIGEVRDGATGALVKQFEFLDDGFLPITAAWMPDADGNGASEIAVLAARKSDGRVVVEMRNVSGNLGVRQVWFASGHTAIDLAIVEDDADSNGVPELAVLSSRNSDGRGLVEVKNAFGATNPRALWAGAGMTSSHVEVVGDADGNGIPDIAILSTRNSDGRIVAEVKNASGATNPTAVWFMPGNTAIDIVAVPDKDNNGVPEVAVLSSRNSDGRIVVEVKNASGPTAPSAVWFAPGHSAIELTALNDVDNNGIPEVAVLSSRDSDGRIVVEIKNAAGATNPNPLWYTPGFTALGLTVVDDADSNGVPEIGVIMIRDSDGRILVQSRNATGVQASKDTWFSP